MQLATKTLERKYQRISAKKNGTGNMRSFSSSCISYIIGPMKDSPEGRAEGPYRKEGIGTEKGRNIQGIKGSRS